MCIRDRIYIYITDVMVNPKRVAHDIWKKNAVGCAIPPRNRLYKEQRTLNTTSGAPETTCSITFPPTITTDSDNETLIWNTTRSNLSSSNERMQRLWLDFRQRWTSHLELCVVGQRSPLRCWVCRFHKFITLSCILESHSAATDSLNANVYIQNTPLHMRQKPT